jgi:hypothetical protein
MGANREPAALLYKAIGEAWFNNACAHRIGKRISVNIKVTYGG